MISICPIAPHEWLKYRDIRLQALQDSPDAFGSTWEAEATRTNENWSTRIAVAAAGDTDLPLFALNGNEVCGLVWCKLSTLEPGTADIFQMWVAPTVRGQGVGRALLKQALAWAKSRGMQRVRLGVTAAESPAMRLYRSHGFYSTGQTEQLREDSDLVAQTMELKLDSPTQSESKS